MNVVILILMVHLMNKPNLYVFECQAQKLCDLCVFFLCLLVRNVVYTLVCTADSRVQVCAIYVYMNSDVEFYKKCPKLCSMKFIMFGINFTIKTELFTRFRC